MVAEQTDRRVAAARCAARGRPSRRGSARPSARRGRSSGRARAGPPAARRPTRQCPCAHRTGRVRPVRIETGTDLLLAEVDGAIARLDVQRPGPAQRPVAGDAGGDRRRSSRRGSADDAVRVIVMTGAGGRAFVAGADIAEFGTRRTAPEDRADYDRRTGAAWRCWRQVTKPVIAMIDGYCIGGGVLMALQADIRICSDVSTFAIPAARLGLGYGFGGVRALMRVVNPAVASEMLFSARRLSAAEAAAAGLVNRVVPARRPASRGRRAGQPDRRQRPAHGAGVQGGDPARRRGRCAPRHVGGRRARRGLLPLRGLPRGPGRVPRQARAGVPAGAEVVPVRICFVCLGQHLPLAGRGGGVRPQGGRRRRSRVTVDSAGTSRYHLGEAAHPNTLAEAARRGIAIEHRARQFTAGGLRPLRSRGGDGRGEPARPPRASLPTTRRGARSCCCARSPPDGSGGRTTCPTRGGCRRAPTSTMFDVIEPACDGLVAHVAAR